MVKKYKNVIVLVGAVLFANGAIYAQDGTAKPTKPTAEQVAEKQASKEYQKQLTELIKVLQLLLLVCNTR